MVCIGTTTIDELGRLLFPAEIRSMLKWQAGDKINVHYADYNTAILQLTTEPTNDACNICGNAKAKISIKGVGICMKCVEQIEALGSLRLLTE